MKQIHRWSWTALENSLDKIYEMTIIPLHFLIFSISLLLFLLYSPSLLSCMLNARSRWQRHTRSCPKLPRLPALASAVVLVCLAPPPTSTIVPCLAPPLPPTHANDRTALDASPSHPSSVGRRHVVRVKASKATVGPTCVGWIVRNHFFGFSSLFSLVWAEKKLQTWNYFTVW